MGGRKAWQNLNPFWVGLIGVLLYLPTLRFVLLDRDDPWLIESNILLHEFSLSSLKKIFFDFSWEQRFRLGAEYLPARDVSVMLDHAFFGSFYQGHHFMQVLLYGLACGLAAWVVHLWTGRRALAWIFGFLYAVHPTHVEAVAWLSERKGVLGAVFFFASLGALHRYVRDGGAWAWAATTLLFVFSVFSKAHMVAGLGVVVALLWMYADVDDLKQRALGLILFVAAGAASFVPAFSVGRLIGMVQPYNEEGVSGAMSLFALIHGLYLKLMAWAGPYAIHYPVETSANVETFRLIGATALVAMVVFVFWTIIRRKRSSPVFVGIACWLAFLAPVSHLVFPIQNLMADRYLLLPSFGLLLALSSLILYLPTRLAVLTACALALLSTLISFAQTQTWETSDAMWAQAQRVDRTYGTAWEKRAKIAQKSGDLKLAWDLTIEGLSYAPKSWRLHHRQALILQQKGKHGESLLKFKIAAMFPEADKAQANLALVLLRQGDLQTARTWADRAVQTVSKAAHNQRVFGMVAMQQKDLEAACPAFEIALKLMPDDAENQYNAGICDAQSGRRARAKRRLEEALRIDSSLEPNIAAVLKALAQQQ